MQKTAALVFCGSVILAGLLQSCRAKPDPPSLSTAPVIYISARSAFGGGEIVSDGGSPEEWKVLKGSVDSQYGVGDPEWELTRYQGYDAGGNLRAVSGWREGVLQGTDLYDFTGLPGGYRKYDGGIFLIGDCGYFWTSTKTGDFYWSHYLLWGTSEAGREYFWADYGFSVRCLRDD